MKLFRRHSLFCIRRGEAIPEIKAHCDLRFERVTRENVADILTFRTEEFAVVFERQLQKGQLGVYAYVDGRAVAHGWMIINRQARPVRANDYFVLRPREALVHFCSVAEQHRGKGIYQALLCELYRQAFATEPVDTIYIDTVIDNVPSRKAIAKTAQFVTNAYYVNVLSKGFRLPFRGGKP